MSRARGRKQQETIEFFEENPELVEYDVQVGVTSVDGPKGEIFLPDVRDGLGFPINDPEGEDFFGPAERMFAPDEVTLALGVLPPDALLFAPGGEGGPLPGLFPMLVENNSLTLTEEGIGILGEDERDALDDALGEDEALPTDAKAINEGEVLFFGYGDLLPIFEQEPVEPGPPGMLTDVLIEFTVLNDAGGTVGFQAGSIFGPEEPFEEEFQIAPNSEDSTGQFEVDFLPDDFVNLWALSVTEGDVAIAVTGISYAGITLDDILIA